ncbi:MAG: spermidine synthase [Sphingobium sp.]
MARAAEAAAVAKSARGSVEVVDIAQIPGGGLLHLLRCGDDFSIQFGSDELMGSRDYLSEQALATMTRDRLGRNDARVLVGGLGMGFTLGAALAAWDAPASSIIVAELVPSVATWARGPLAHLSGTHLSDPRVSLQVADVHDVIMAAGNAEADGFDAILLDVDNGPDGFMLAENDRLYCNWGLRAARSALRPGGILSVWSSYADESFGQRLTAAGFDVEEVRMPAYAGANDDWHNIWFASRIN